MPILGEEKSYKFRVTWTTVSMVLFAWAVVGLFLYFTFIFRMHDAEEEINSQRVKAVASDMKVQFNTLITITNKISNDAKFYKRRADENHYQEVGLIEVLEKHNISSPLIENIFVIFKEDEKEIFSSAYGKSDFDVFCRHYGIVEHVEELYVEMRQVNDVNVFAFSEWIIVTVPCFSTDNAVIGYTIPASELEKHIYLIAGELNGEITIYYQDMPWIGTAPTALKAGTYDLENKGRRYVSEQAGEFQVILDTWERLEYLNVETFSKTIMIYLLSLCVILVLLALGIAYYNYRPIDSLIFKYKSKGISDGLNELSALEALMDTALENEETIRKKMTEQYKVIRRQLLSLIVQGDEAHCALAVKGFMGLRLSGPWYALMIFEHTERMEKREMLEDMAENMSTPEMQCCCVPISYPQFECILISLSEKEGLEEGEGMIRELFEGYGMVYCGTSAFYMRLERTPVILEYTMKVGRLHGRQLIENEKEWIFTETMLIKQNLLQKMQQADMRAVREVWGVYLQGVQKTAPIESLERYVHGELIHEICIRLHKDNMNINMSEVVGILSCKTMENMRKYTFEFLMKSTEEYKEDTCVEAMQSMQNNKHVKIILAFIEEHLGDVDLSLDLLADQFKLSTRYVSTLVKEATGQSYKMYLTDKRMETAKELLAQKELTVQEVCQRVGYNNLPNFIKTFKRFTGETPGGYAERMRQ